MFEPEFDPSKMERFLKRDTLIRFVVADLVKRGHTREKALEVAFNGYVLEDSVMIREYEKAQSLPIIIRAENSKCNMGGGLGFSAALLGSKVEGDRNGEIDPDMGGGDTGVMKLKQMQFTAGRIAVRPFSYVCLQLHCRLEETPGSFEFYGGLSALYRQVGIAVPPNLAYVLACQIVKALRGGGPGELMYKREGLMEMRN